MKRICALIAGALLALPLAAQTIEQLPAPQKKGGLSTTEALWQRQSTRQYAPEALSRQDLADLLWAACGVNRPESGRLTNPTAMNLQEITVYVFTPEAVYRYDAKGHALVPITTGDHRGLVAGRQDFAKTAPLSLVIVADLGKYRQQDERALMMAAADAGIVSQNINLYCAARGWATVTRASMDSDGLSKLLGLTATQKPVLNNPVGYMPK